MGFLDRHVKYSRDARFIKSIIYCVLIKADENDAGIQIDASVWEIKDNDLFVDDTLEFDINVDTDVGAEVK